MLISFKEHFGLLSEKGVLPQGDEVFDAEKYKKDKQERFVKNTFFTSLGGSFAWLLTKIDPTLKDNPFGVGVTDIFGLLASVVAVLYGAQAFQIWYKNRKANAGIEKTLKDIEVAKKILVNMTYPERKKLMDQVWELKRQKRKNRQGKGGSEGEKILDAILKKINDMNEMDKNNKYADTSSSKTNKQIDIYVKFIVRDLNAIGQHKLAVMIANKKFVSARKHIEELYTKNTDDYFKVVEILRQNDTISKAMFNENNSVGSGAVAGIITGEDPPVRKRRASDNDYLADPEEVEEKDKDYDEIEEERISFKDFFYEKYNLKSLAKDSLFMTNPILYTLTMNRNKRKKKKQKTTFKESSAPGTEEWILNNKARFKKRYGADWKKMIYAHAWNLHKKHGGNMPKGFGKHRG